MGGSSALLVDSFANHLLCIIRFMKWMCLMTEGDLFGEQEYAKEFSLNFIRSYQYFGQHQLSCWAFELYYCTTWLSLNLPAALKKTDIWNWKQLFLSPTDFIITWSSHLKSCIPCVDMCLQLTEGWMCHTTRSQILNLAQVSYRTSESLADRAAFWLS